MPGNQRMNSQDVHQVNAMQTKCIREFGGVVIRLGTFLKASVCMEGVICGLILAVARAFQVDPTALTDAIFSGVKVRMKEVLEKEES